MINAASIGLSTRDLYLFNKGDLFHSYRTFGAHPIRLGDEQGVRFTVWAPNAEEVRVVGSFNEWNGTRHAMERVGETGVWSVFIAGIGTGTVYKYEIESKDGSCLLKSDPYAFHSERRPSTASVVTDLGKYKWTDGDWQRRKQDGSPYHEQMLIYEVHLGSWRNRGKENFWTYEEMAVELVNYAADMGYTHLELLPITEHPLDQSWGYQVTGYYSATSRYGTPEQLMHLIDRCHARGIGVILDWVPGHFCKDDHGLRLFDGTPIFEGTDWKRAEKPIWGTLAFDFGRTEVQSFLTSNAIFWMDVFHIDGLRVDAVASMLDLHFDKPPELWTYNKLGGKENTDAIRFLKRLNETVFHYYPDALMIAEDSSSWPAVTSPTYMGGLGFNFKWNMGWMNDMLRYMALDPQERMHHHNLITFSLMYAFSENYVLPLSHDEVVHGKRSLLNKMPGSYEQKFAQLRLFYGFWMTHPGKKLLFMGSEWGQFDEWKDAESLDWLLLEYEKHERMHHYVQTLNLVYNEQASLWERDCDPGGFEWIDVHNAAQSVVVFMRRGLDAKQFTISICNFSVHEYSHYTVGVPEPGSYRVILHSDKAVFGGEIEHAPDLLHSRDVPWHGRPCSMSVRVPPLSFQLLTYDQEEQTQSFH
ncbi:1,4-alpha-glucan branching enzyme GlgB [Paenibacillus baekrokdamisoli]|uniref:1,4-alpha-glucan branching enzyme GlgB n=1 Tax=Paenibacillus baekrokdamisoli TaxID=1712516 RepID=A0A3G9J943_9BACL|nr:1,4-alpha-glucan branching protein GlgB [Paenibacillus baekrokdamisoli]MBB3067232.1 1,4-alpha-glucan branching enzyme [Paenibacillus baekrokdamisoli]BBH19579.1 1,4-alpha-glucan branching enzyme GlgB [Paenibacillus baekrokdamisoli]